LGTNSANVGTLAVKQKLHQLPHCITKETVGDSKNLQKEGDYIQFFEYSQPHASEFEDWFDPIQKNDDPSCRPVPATCPPRPLPRTRHARGRAQTAPNVPSPQR